MYMAAAAFFFSLMGLLVRIVKGIPFMEVVFFRSAVMFVIPLIGLIREYRPLFGKHKVLLLARGLFGFVGLSAYFYTIHAMPLAEAVTIQYTNPIFTALWSPLILKERATRFDWLATVVSFLGVFFIARPDSLSHALPAAIGLGGAACSGLAYNLVRKLGGKGEDHRNIVFAFTVVSLGFSTPAALAQWVMPDTVQFALLIGIGVTTYIAQIALTKGLRAERASRATVMNYLVILLSTVYSILLGEALHPYTLGGIALIAAGIAVLQFGKRHEKARAAG